MAGVVWTPTSSPLPDAVIVVVVILLEKIDEAESRA